MANLALHSLSSSNRLRRELIQGDEYRNFKRNEDTLIQPVRSPVDISFFVHRKRYVKKVEENIKLTKSAPAKASTTNSTRREVKSKSVPHIKHSFWERAKLSHKQYACVLSTPHLHCSGDSGGVKSYHSQTTPNICSPRLAQMAHPNNRRILGVWQEYGHKLPVDAIQRLHDMLYTNQSIDMKEARNFFKICDRKKRKQKRRLKLKKKRKRNQKEATWLRKQLEDTSSLILNYFSKEPNLDPSFKQLLLSDVLLTLIGNFTKRKQPILRYSPNLYDRALVKMVDKIAIWTDNVSKTVEIQGLEDEDEEDQKDTSQISEKSSSVASSVTLSENEPDESETKGSRVEEGSENLGAQAEGEGEEEAEEELEKVSSLQRLIEILARASAGYLSSTVDYEDLTRNELLHRMKILNKDYVDTTPAEVMKSILLDWAMHNAPDQVDSEIINKIDKMSEIIVAMLEAEEVYGMMGMQPEEVTDQKGSAEGQKDAKPGSLPGTIKSTDKTDVAGSKPGSVAASKPGSVAASKPGSEAASKPGSVAASSKKASDLIKVTDFEEGDKPEPGTLTEIKAPDGTVQMGVIDENGEITPVQLTPSGNLIPTVYDKNAKVVNEVFDKDGNRLDSTFNKYGVPEPDNYNDALFDDEKKPHELIFNDKGKIIPQCYDKDGNPIAADYDSDGNPLFFGEDGQPIPVKPGESVKIEDGKIVVINKDDQPTEEDKKAGDNKKEVAKETGTEDINKSKGLEPLPEENETEDEKATEEENQEEEKKSEKQEEVKKEESTEDTNKQDDEMKEKKNVDEAKAEEKKKDKPGEDSKEGEEELTTEKKTEEMNKDEEKPKEDSKDEGKILAEEKIEDKSIVEKNEEEKKIDKQETEDKALQEEKDEIAIGDEIEKDKKDKKVEREETDVIAEKEQGKKEEEEKGEEGKGEETVDSVEQKEGEKEGEEEKEEQEEEEEGKDQEEIRPVDEEKQEIGEQEENLEEIEEDEEEQERDEDEGEESVEEEELETETELSASKSEEEEEEIREQKEEGVSPTASRESMVTVIKGHTPKRVQEHSKDTVCCLSMKIWAVWLLEITHNAHNWTKWISNIISQIREFAAILRGEVLLPNGQKKVIYKEDWNKFVEEMNEEVIAWRQYNRHVNDLTKKIIDKFHGKKVHCCEKCLQDHLIKNVVTAHDTMTALTEALNCTGYWQRCLDEIVEATSKLFTVQPPVDESSSEGETGWSYSSSSEDETMPSSAWRNSPSNPQDGVRQLFPR